MAGPREQDTAYRERGYRLIRGDQMREYFERSRRIERIHRKTMAVGIAELALLVVCFVLVFVLLRIGLK